MTIAAPQVPAELAAAHGGAAPIAMWTDLEDWFEQVHGRVPHPAPLCFGCLTLR